MEENKTKIVNKKNVKKANILDHNSIKQILDESVSEIVKSKGYIEDVRMSNTRLFLGAIIIAIALLAQFYNKKFPENMSFLIVCIILYVVFNGILQLIIYTKEKNAILFTYPPAGSFHTTGLVVSSKLTRFSDMYNLHIASADPKSISANPPVELTKSVAQWFTNDGTLVEGLFWKDVERLVNDYAKKAKKGKKIRVSSSLVLFFVLPVICYSIQMLVIEIWFFLNGLKLEPLCYQNHNDNHEVISSVVVQIIVNEILGWY